MSDIRSLYSRLKEEGGGGMKQGTEERKDESKDNFWKSKEG